MIFNRDVTVLITGGDGLVGRNLAAYLCQLGFAHVWAPCRHYCDLTDRAATVALFADRNPTYAFHMAARERGMMSNMQLQNAAYLENTLINTPVIEAARLSGVKKIVAIGTVAM